MIEALKIEGAFVIRHVAHADERGWFLRVHSEDELRAQKLCWSFPQSNASCTKKALTVRGMHMQKAPNAETKIVTCLQGKVFDVIVDLRPESKSYGRYVSVQLEAGDGQSVYIPEGCAHGFQTMSENVILNYLMSKNFHPQSAVGLNWLDPKLAIAWPSRDQAMITISEKDLLLPFLES